MCSKSSNCRWLCDRQAAACSACQLSSRRKLRQVHRSEYRVEPRHMSRDTYPECEEQHCTQSFHPFAWLEQYFCAKACTVQTKIEITVQDELVNAARHIQQSTKLKLTARSRVSCSSQTNQRTLPGPYRVFAFGWSNHLEFQVDEAIAGIPCHVFKDPLEYGRAT